MDAKERMELMLGGARNVREYTLEGYRPSSVTAEAVAAVGAFDWRRDNLYMHGPAGTGKSHLAVAAARRALDLGAPYAFVEKPMGISRAYRSADGATDETATVKRYVSAPILVIDDLGVEKLTEFLATLLYEIVDGRYSRDGGGLIVTSNVGLDGLAERLGDDRIPSRLVQMCKRFSFVGEPDHRLLQR